MVYLALPVAQMQTGPFSSVNCGPAVTEELISLGSVGALSVSAAKIRAASGDTSGGMEASQLASTANKLTGGLYPLVAMRLDTRQQMSTLLETSSVGLIISCRVTVNTKYRTNSFTGLHWVTVAAGSLKDGTYKVEDPGTTYAGWLRWPKDLLFRAAEAVGDFFILRGVRTEDAEKHAVTQGTRVFAQPDKDSKVVKRLDKGETVHVKRTTKGGPWRTADGRNAYGWHEIGAGYCKGESLR